MMSLFLLSKATAVTARSSVVRRKSVTSIYPLPEASQKLMHASRSHFMRSCLSTISSDYLFLFPKCLFLIVYIFVRFHFR